MLISPSSAVRLRNEESPCSSTTRFTSGGCSIAGSSGRGRCHLRALLAVALHRRASEYAESLLHAAAPPCPRPSVVLTGACPRVRRRALRDETPVPRPRSSLRALMTDGIDPPRPSRSAARRAADALRPWSRRARSPSSRSWTHRRGLNALARTRAAQHAPPASRCLELRPGTTTARPATPCPST